MEGVEILNQFEVAVEYAFNFKTFCTSLVIVIIVGALVGIIASLCENDWSLLIGCIVISVLCGLFMSTIISGLDSVPTKYETRYKVTVADEVKMSEFCERYEILDQEGKIYIVREK